MPPCAHREQAKPARHRSFHEIQRADVHERQADHTRDEMPHPKSEDADNPIEKQSQPTVSKDQIEHDAVETGENESENEWGHGVL